LDIDHCFPTRYIILKSNNIDQNKKQVKKAGQAENRGFLFISGIKKISGYLGRFQILDSKYANSESHFNFLF